MSILLSFGNLIKISKTNKENIYIKISSIKESNNIFNLKMANPDNRSPFFY